MTTPADISAPVSFGLNLYRPGLLETRSTGDVLRDIQSGRWQDKVAFVRSLPQDGPEQSAAKKSLPYAIWAGVFSHRANDKLRQHAGQIGVDLDALGDTKSVATIQNAVADRFCLAAFRSTRGAGVRLLFRIPPCSPEDHANAFEQVAGHVRNTYGCEADETGKDVSRASFVSFDRGLWVNPSADVLPIILPVSHSGSGGFSRCVPPALYAGQLAETCWTCPTLSKPLPITHARLLGADHAPWKLKPDGFTYTHQSLLELSKCLALYAAKNHIPKKDEERLLNDAFGGWIVEAKRRERRLRCYPSEYRKELGNGFRGAQRRDWFVDAATKWTRWLKHPDFPNNGTPRDRLWFAICRHCADAETKEFFIGCRDAGNVAGVSNNTASKILISLRKDGLLALAGRPWSKRHASIYRLKF